MEIHSVAHTLQFTEEHNIPFIDYSSPTRGVANFQALLQDKANLRDKLLLPWLHNADANAFSRQWGELESRITITCFKRIIEGSNTHARLGISSAYDTLPSHCAVVSEKSIVRARDKQQILACVCSEVFLNRDTNRCIRARFYLLGFFMPDAEWLRLRQPVIGARIHAVVYITPVYLIGSDKLSYVPPTHSDPVQSFDEPATSTSTPYIFAFESLDLECLDMMNEREIETLYELRGSRGVQFDDHRLDAICVWLGLFVCAYHGGDTRLMYTFIESEVSFLRQWLDIRCSTTVNQRELLATLGLADQTDEIAHRLNAYYTFGDFLCDLHRTRLKLQLGIFDQESARKLAPEGSELYWIVKRLYPLIKYNF